MSPISSHGEACLGYLREGYAAWQNPRGTGWAFAVRVEHRLGLSLEEGIACFDRLTQLGLIQPYPGPNLMGTYRLTLKGVAFMEMLPWLEEAARSLFSVIDADPDLGDEEKEQARAGLWSEALEAAFTLSLGWAIEHLPDLWKERKR
ncbi:MAG: hypothetical protein HY347_01420 [candidate division NC10 bacterium]|nr:hypothetical protein [candidate division NC10 bacterium]